MPFVILRMRNGDTRHAVLCDLSPEATLLLIITIISLILICLRKRLQRFLKNKGRSADGCIKQITFIQVARILLLNRVKEILIILFGLMYYCVQDAEKNLFFGCSCGCRTWKGNDKFKCPDCGAEVTKRDVHMLWRVTMTIKWVRYYHVQNKFQFR